jgi:hypothetical protein
MSGGINVLFSDYGDVWWSPEGTEIDAGETEFVIGDTPRYVNIELFPVTEIKYKDIFFNVSTEDFYAGRKGCEYEFTTTHAKKGTTSESQIIEFKNIYDTPYDLYIDIPPETLEKSGLIFHSKLNNFQSVTNPIVGPDAHYIKEEDYPLVFVDHNCAVNCHCWALRNLVEGNQGYYKKSDNSALVSLGELHHNQILNFYNVGASNKSILKIPVNSRNRYWKITGKTPAVKMNIREISLFRNGQKLDADFYYEVGDSRYTDLCFNGTPGALNGTAANAFDKNPNTYWQPSSTDIGNWLSYTFPSPVAVHAFSLSCPALENVLYTFALQASISGTFTGSDLIELAVYNDTTYASFSYDHYTCSPSWEYNTTTGFFDFLGVIDNITPYRYYRIFNETCREDSLNTNSTGGRRISEFKLLSRTGYSDFYNKPLTHAAPHIENDSVTGSYYQIHKNNCIGFDLGAQKELDTIEFYHDAIGEIDPEIYVKCTDNYCEGQRRCYYDTFCGIDTATWIYITAEGDRSNFVLKEESYYEHLLTLGSGIVKENDYDTFDISYAMSETFSNCGALTDWFATDGSRFSCVSGTPNYLSFNFRGNPNNGTGYYKSLRNIVNDASSRFFIDETTAFRARFKISFDDFYMDYEGADRYGHMIVGLVGSRSGAYASMFGGVKVYFGTSQYQYQRYVSLSVMDYNHAGYQYDYYSKNVTVVPTTVSGLLVDTPYYVEITGDGNYNYTAKIWTDDWNGSVLKGSAVLKCYSKIRASEFGVYYESGSLHNIGKIYEMHIDYLEKSVSKKQVGGSIAFNGAGALTVQNNYGVILKGKQFELDVFIMFYKLPVQGQPVTVCRLKDNSFKLTIEYSSGSYILKLVSTGNNTGWTRGIDPHIGCWHHVAAATNYYDSTSSNYHLFFDGRGGPYNNFNHNNFGVYSLYDFELGENLIGCMSNFRLSSDNSSAGSRSYPRTAIPLPTKKYEKRYSFSIYVSADNVSYGKYADVDLFNGYTNVYYSPESVLSSFYNTYFYVNLGQRHYLDIVRNYGTSSAYQITKNKYLTYSKTQSDNFDDINFKYADNVSDSFSTGLKPDKFLWSYTDNPDLYIDDQKLRIKNTGNYRITQELKSQYLFNSDFDIQMDYSIIHTEGGHWNVGLFVEDYVLGGQVGVQRRYDSTYSHSYFATTESGIVVFYRPATAAENTGQLRLRRRGQNVNAYYKKDTEWDLVHQWVNWSFNDVRVVLRTYTTSVKFETYIDNFIVNKGESVVRDGYKDAQWARINLPNGDGVSRLIYQLGIYPEISINVSPAGDKHNTYWDYLGPSLTDYTEGVNVAAGATVTGSSYTESMYWASLTDGYLGETLQESWGSANENNPWVVIDLGSVRNIYRIKIYHGFSSTNSDILAKNYQVDISQNGISYTTIFNISGNTALERIHDLTQPVNARYVRIYITSYDTLQVYIRAGEKMIFFRGVCIREVEVFGYYGYPIISSEQYPIVGINLRKQFYLDSNHTLIGVDAESVNNNWSGSANNFAYSDNPFDNPEGVVFRPFGAGPGYDQWVAIKQNTATSYNSGPDYLKNAIIRSTTAPNPCDYYWWWSSNISTISRGYNDVVFSVFPVQIDYPASTIADTIYTRIADSFGIDEDVSWRDGIYFRMNIDDINNFDIDYGYFFVKGKDGTSKHAPIEHRWNFTTVSGVLKSGWSIVFLQFKYADSVIYDKTIVERSGENPLELDKITFLNFGMVFRGKGQAIRIYLDGFFIGRNHFESYSQFDQGLYLKGKDILTAPIGEFHPNFGSIEFWFRPDYGYTGQDYLKRFKHHSVFHFGNSSGDVFGMCVGSSGLIIYYGHTYDLRALAVGEITNVTFDTLVHIGIVYSATGLATGDGTTIKIFMNNKLLGYTTDTWEVNDAKLFKFIFGGQGLLGIKEGDRGFSRSIMDLPDELRGDNLNSPSKLIEISKDNLTFYKVGDPALPFIFKNVPPGSAVPIYFRTVIPGDLTGAEKRTSAIVGSWDIGV